MHSMELEFAGEPSSVPAARRMAADVLASAGAEGDSWTTVQVVSELATNAVVHAATPFVVHLTVNDDHVRVAVTDSRPAVAPIERAFSDDTTTGRGLRLVEMLSRAWGVDTADTTKTVWSVIARVTVGVDGDDASAANEIGAQTAAQRSRLPRGGGRVMLARSRVA